MTLTINCGAEGETKSERYSGTTKLDGKGTAALVTLTLSEHNINVKDHCTVEAKISAEAPTTDFKVSYKQIDGAPTLAADAAVTLNNGKVMVHTGAMPTETANIDNAIEVYVSTNRGFAWTKSNSITQWTSIAADSGITMAGNSSDYTRNMVMIRITNTGHTPAWWHIHN